MLPTASYSMHQEQTVVNKKKIKEILISVGEKWRRELFPPPYRMKEKHKLLHHYVNRTSNSVSIKRDLCLFFHCGVSLNAALTDLGAFLLLLLMADQ